MWGRRFIVLGTLVLWGLAVLGHAAAAPSFERRVWSRADGAPQSAYGIAQDKDGMLWFATTTGLYNFDGAHFTRQETVFGQRLASNNVVAVVATRDGIAVGYQFGGVSVFRPGGARHYTGADGLPAGSVGVLVVDAAQTLYAGSSTGLARLDPRSDRWSAFAGLDGPSSYVVRAMADDAGTIWALSNSHLYAMPRGETRFRPVTALAPTAIPELVHGKVMAYTDSGRLVRFDAALAPTVLRDTVGFDRDAVMFGGPYGTVWAWLKGGTTLLRAGTDGVLHAAQRFEGGSLPGRMVSRTLVDRENNLWVTTLDGVERYRLRRLHELSLPVTAQALHVGPGLGQDMLVASGNEGQVWRVRRDGIEPVAGITGISASHRENARSLWLGGTSGIYHVTPAGTRHWPLPSQTTRNFSVQAITTDRSGNLWVAIARHGLFRLTGSAWTRQPVPLDGGDETPVCMLTLDSGRTYFGFTGGRVAELTAGGLRPVAANLAIGNVLSLAQHDGALLAGGERGVVRLADGAALPVLPEQMAAFLGISGMAVDRQGDLWLHGPDGLFHVRRQELRRSRQDPAYRLRWETFNFEDGLRGQVAQIRPLPTLTAASDGRIYYATGSQVGWIDPAAILRNPRAPTVLVQSLRANGRSIAATPGMTLAPGTTGVDVRFAATALSIPERVRFRYRLVGVDQDWQEPLLERAARYTNLGPGDYRFLVVAANEDGVWNNTGAVLDFRIAPRPWQTWWFRAGTFLLAAALVFMLYRWRIAAVARRAADKAAARTEERERIARNLHDNLLQGVQGLILRCHAVLMRMPKGTAEEQALGDALARADAVVEETRDEVMNLRRGGGQPALIGRLREFIETLPPQMASRTALRFSGSLERLGDDVANEIFCVLREAIGNSASHSGAQEIVVSLHASARGIDGSVADDGCGIAPEFIRAGRAGHWGLPGMRERMARVGGMLRISAGAAGGCTISFHVPADAAY